MAPYFYTPKDAGDTGPRRRGSGGMGPSPQRVLRIVAWYGIRFLPTEDAQWFCKKEGRGAEGEGRSDRLMTLSRSPAAIIARLLVLFPPRASVSPSPAFMCSLSLDICVLPLLVPPPALQLYLGQDGPKWGEFLIVTLLHGGASARACFQGASETV